MAITAKSFAQLMLGLIPADDRVGTVRATLNGGGMGLAEARIDVRAESRGGTIFMDMTPSGFGPVTKCAADSNGQPVACQQFVLPGGVTAMESVAIITPTKKNATDMGWTYMLEAEIQRSAGITVRIQVFNYNVDPNTIERQPPAAMMTMNQMIAIVGDPRWEWTMDASFVAASSGLQLQPGSPDQ